MKSSIFFLQDWFIAHCDGQWEHEYGIDITTIDNPGWKVRINGLNHGIELDLKSEIDDNDWYFIKIKTGEFVGYCSPQHLGKLLDIFIDNCKI